MNNINISEFPWLCSTTGYNEKYTCSNKETGSSISESESNLAEIATTESYGTYGLKLTYYKISLDLEKDKILAEDTLQQVERAFYIIIYTESIPSNVRTYQLQGIWGEDLITCYIGKTAFKYWSTYGGLDRNTPEIYDDFIPRIGDIVYMEYNDTFYEIRDIKYYSEAFGLTSHTYTLTLKVYKDYKLTINTSNPTLSNSEDPIYKVSTNKWSSQYNTNDILKNNNFLDTDNLTKSNNSNHMDVLYHSQNTNKF